MDNQVNIDELREAENAGSDFVPTEKSEPTDSANPSEPASGAGVESADGKAEPVVADGQSTTDDAGKSTKAPVQDLSWLSETPYKSPDELVKGYKALQAEHGKTSEKFKPYKDLIERAESDFALRTFLTQAIQGYDNPQLLGAYDNGTAEPNPQNYDLVDPAGQAKFMADVKAYNERTIDQRINARLAGVEQNAKIEAAKNVFRAAHPGADPDEVINFARTKREWSLEDIHRIMTFDNVKSEAMAEARKEVTKQLEVAQKSKTPQASTGAVSDVRPEDVLEHISKYGSVSARKKYGDPKVLRVMQETA